MTEHRTPDVLTKLRDAERAQADAARLAYLDPEKSHQAREEGNTLFKAGDFAGAVKAYTESIKRDPADPRGYNNRSNAYTKLAALPEALKDAEEAIKVDPKFVKAYIRKSHVLFVMKDYAKAIEAIDAASVVDEDKKHTREIQDQMSKCQQAMFSQRTDESEEETLERAMRDPEVAVRIIIHEVTPDANLIVAEHYGRSRHAIYTSTSTNEPCCSPRSHEKSYRPPEDHEARECWNHQDSLKTK